ncbi:MAG: EAL domain-containing protein [Wenzhouxiangella sp.]
MKLVHLSLASIATCMLALLLMVVITLNSVGQVREKQAQVAELLALHARVNDFSVASNRLLLFGADAELLAAYRQEGQALPQHLLQRNGAAEHKTANSIEQLLDTVTAEIERNSAPDAVIPGTHQGALALPERSLIVLTQVAELGSALDSALDSLLRDRQREIAREAWWIGAVLAGLALIFGLLSVIAFLLIHRRIAKPASAITHMVKAIRAGNTDARAIVHGDDELAELSRTLNAMLDERELLDARLREKNKGLRQYQQLFEGIGDLCVIVDGAYAYRWANRAYLATYRTSMEAIVGRTLAEVAGERLFREQIKPRLDLCLAGEPQRFEIERDFEDLGTRRFLVRQYPIYLTDKPSERRAGLVLTDITEIRAAEAKLARQRQLLDMAGQVARFGGWFVDLDSQRIEWSDTVAEIHGMPHGYSPSIEDGISFYAPEYRERIRELFTACVEQGVPYDEELQIIDAHGQRLWVRSLGEPVRDERGRIVHAQGAFQDVTGRREHEAELRASRDELAALLASRKTLINSLPAHICVVDAEGTVVEINDQWRHYGEQNAYSGDDFGVGMNYFNVCQSASGDCAEDAAKVAAGLRTVLDGEQDSFALEYPCHSPQQLQWFRVNANRMRPGNNHGANLGAVVMHIDITERKQAEAREVQARELMQYVIEHNNAAVAVHDCDLNYLFVSQKYLQIFGLAGQDVIGKHHYEVFPHLPQKFRDAHQRVLRGEIVSADEDLFEHPDGREDWTCWECRPWFKDKGAIGGLIVYTEIITDRKQAEQQLERIAFEDRLTGLYTRNGFARHLQQRIKQDGWPAAAALAMVDIVGLRDVNDTLGYQGGDRVLVEFSRRLAEQASEQALAGRIAGDEFTLLVGPDTGETIAARMNRLIESLSAPFELDGITIEVAIRLGYSCLGEDQRPAEDLLREAERALFRHRKEVSFPWVAYSSRLEDETHERIELTRDLRRAIVDCQFELHFQPQVDLATGGLVSCEALLRWNHPKKGLIPPGLFIPIAEQSQLIGPIGDWVLRRACQHLREWRDAGLAPVRVSVNVSLIQFQINDFTHRVQTILEEFGVDPAELALEITENVFERESENLLRQMQALHKLGVWLSLDDFGTGYSSLTYLQRYPFDEIKIDQTFIFRLLDDSFSRQVVETVLVLARTLQAEAVAEGIESAAVSDALQAMGCRLGQGYFYSMPLEAEDFRWLLEQRSPLPLAARSAP